MSGGFAEVRYVGSSGWYVVAATVLSLTVYLLCLLYAATSACMAFSDSGEDRSDWRVTAPPCCAEVVLGVAVAHPPTAAAAPSAPIPARKPRREVSMDIDLLPDASLE